MWLWDAWFNPNSFYSYCAVVPFISGALIYQNIKLGKLGLKDMAFPVLFLAFMFPLPAEMTDPISHHLKYFSAGLSTCILNLLQIHAVQEGNMIKMPHSATIVDDACSGIRAIISLLAMGGLFVYWMKSDVSKKFMLMFSVIPVALLTNSLRIVFLSVVLEFYGAKYTKGIVHDIAGFLIYGTAFLLFFLISKALSNHDSGRMATNLPARTVP